ncbi:MAG: hypothetical protein Q4C81_00925 [Kocuria sp.]|nr:hypothetical protein [Kocuria sp.]
MPGFLITYNRRTGKSEVQQYAGQAGHRKAFAERLRLEKDREDPDIEIVSLAGHSLDAIRRTHRRYFLRETQPL